MLAAALGAGAIEDLVGSLESDELGPGDFDADSALVGLDLAATGLEVDELGALRLDACFEVDAGCSVAVATVHGRLPSAERSPFVRQGPPQSRLLGSA